MAYRVNFGPTKTGAIIVDLPTAKLNSKIEFSEEDDLLEIFVDAAASEIENYLGQPILERSEVKFTLANWNAGFHFPFQVNSVTAVKYMDANYSEKVIASEDWLLFNNTLVIKTEMPGDFESSLIIECAAGYPNAEMPGDIKKAALLIFSHSDTYRENMPIKLETSAKAILRPYKIY